MNAKLSEVIAFASPIDPQAVGTTAVTSAYFKPSKQGKILVEVHIGSVHLAGGSVSVLNAADTSGTSAAALVTTAVGTANANSIWLYNFDGKDLSQTLPYVAISVLGGDSTGTIFEGKILGGNNRYLASDSNSAEVTIQL